MATGIRRVTGIGFDGSTVAITIGKTEMPLTMASYGEKLTTAWLAEMGSQTRGEQSAGVYEPEDGKLKMSSRRFRADFMPLLPVNGFGLVRLPIVVSFAHPDLGSDSDLLENCRFTNLANALEASAKVQEIELTFSLSQIRWTNRRMTINALKGAIPVGAVAI